MIKRQVKKYNLDNFLDVGNEEENVELSEEEPTRPARADVILDEEDDELERPIELDADEDLEEDDYG